MSVATSRDIQPAEVSFAIKQLFCELNKIRKEIEAIERESEKDRDNVWQHIDAIEENSERILFGSSTSGLTDQNSGIVHRLRNLEEKLDEIREEEKKKADRQLIWKTTIVTLSITAIVSFGVAMFQVGADRNPNNIPTIQNNR